MAGAKVVELLLACESPAQVLDVNGFLFVEFPAETYDADPLCGCERPCLGRCSKAVGRDPCQSPTERIPERSLDPPQVQAQVSEFDRRVGLGHKVEDPPVVSENLLTQRRTALFSIAASVTLERGESTKDADQADKDDHYVVSAAEKPLPEDLTRIVILPRRHAHRSCQQNEAVDGPGSLKPHQTIVATDSCRWVLLKR